MIDNNNMWDNFPFCNCNLATDWTKTQTSFATDISNSGNKWSMFKIKECMLFIKTLLVSHQK